MIKQLLTLVLSAQIDDQVVAAVNFNSRRDKSLLQGIKLLLNVQVYLCKGAGAKRVLPLPVSVPSHCALMADAATEQLAAELEKISIY